MSKQRAFLAHLTLSALIVGTVCALIFFFWYPAPYFAAKGAWNALRVLLGVDLVVGPILTLYLYRPNKPGLLIDMTFVAVVQLTALVYGTAVIYRERPYFTVFAVDRFEVIASHEVDFSEINYPELLDKPLAGPIYVAALRPDTTEGMQALLDEVIFQGAADIERRPEFWHPYSDHVDGVLERAVGLEELSSRNPESGDEIQRLVASIERPIEEVVYLPLIGRDRNFAMVIDGQTAEPIDLIDVEPFGQ